MSKTAAEILDDMMDAIQAHGWVRGSVGDRLRGFCIIGAAAAMSHPGMGEARVRVLNAISHAIYDECGVATSISRWNDQLAGGQEDVLLVLKRARESLGGQ